MVFIDPACGFSTRRLPSTSTHFSTSKVDLRTTLSGSLHEENGHRHNNRRNVVMKARQEGSEIRGYDISDSAMDPTFLKVTFSK